MNTRIIPPVPVLNAALRKKRRNSSSSLAVKIARLAVHTKVFPLYEVEGGLRYHINVNPKNLPVDEYLRLQGRFNHLSDEDIQRIQETVDREWERLLKKALDTI